MLRNLIALRKIVLLVLWIVPSFAIGYLLQKLSKTWLRVWVRIFWSIICKIIKISITVQGHPLGQKCFHKDIQERPVIFVANHTSWLDIPVLGSVIYGSFVAKKDMRSWPILGWACGLGQTLFVTRKRAYAGQEAQYMQDLIYKRGENIILFPEGTSSDGRHLHSFKSSFFSLAYPSEHYLAQQQDARHERPVVQPITLIYNRLDALPVTFMRQDSFAWYGDMTLLPHIWKFLRQESSQVRIIFSNPLEPNYFRNRKMLSKTCYEEISSNFSH